MPAKSQTKKMCAKKDCTNLSCPFPHPKPYEPVENALKPKYVVHGAVPFNPRLARIHSQDIHVGGSKIPIPSFFVSQPTDDQLKICLHCNKQFTFTIGEATYFYDNKLRTPKRCKECRGAARRDDLVDFK